MSDSFWDDRPKPGPSLTQFDLGPTAPARTVSRRVVLLQSRVVADEVACLISTRACFVPYAETLTMPHGYMLRRSAAAAARGRR
jgi:hypothetical protein